MFLEHTHTPESIYLPESGSQHTLMVVTLYTPRPSIFIYKDPLLLKFSLVLVGKQMSKQSHLTVTSLRFDTESNPVENNQLHTVWPRRVVYFQIENYEHAVVTSYNSVIPVIREAVTRFVSKGRVTL